ncbi:hypothetical protein [Tannerella sp.]|uniref:hypothetical protein n=1 Tax=Tannerella sp. TaxID=2382127 RepID=UPI0026DD12CC|nr:hypothetical protein [Tannerella sp.]MDO4703120.1 hypothetical protein [Tannerella sp.]
MSNKIQKISIFASAIKKSLHILIAIQFGKTWWGEHWLRSLENADYDNRLPRGAAYARSGYVQSVKMNNNTIMAKVSESRPSPYRPAIF